MNMIMKRGKSDFPSLVSNAHKENELTEMHELKKINK